MAAETEKDLLRLRKRFLELGEKSYAQNLYTFTGFLSLAEQEVLWNACGEIPHIPVALYGGTEQSERQMARFGSPEEFGYAEEFPIVCLAISPAMEKFAENLTHRDFLGALMNLGIDRSTLGDIFIQGKCAWLFCTDKIADYICENLTKVKHTNVICKRAEGDREFVIKEPEEQTITAASERIDGVIAKVYGISRTQTVELFRAKKIYVNGRLNENISYILKEGDSVTVRGSGKFRYLGMQHLTKKGKCSIRVAVFR